MQNYYEIIGLYFVTVFCIPIGLLVITYLFLEIMWYIKRTNQRTKTFIFYLRNEKEFKEWLKSKQNDT